MLFSTILKRLQRFGVPLPCRNRRRGDGRGKIGTLEWATEREILRDTPLSLEAGGRAGYDGRLRFDNWEMSAWREMIDAPVVRRVSQSSACYADQSSGSYCWTAKRHLGAIAP